MAGAAEVYKFLPTPRSELTPRVAGRFNVREHGDGLYAAGITNFGDIGTG